MSFSDWSVKRIKTHKHKASNIRVVSRWCMDPDYGIWEHGHGRSRAVWLFGGGRGIVADSMIEEWYGLCAIIACQAKHRNKFSEKDRHTYLAFLRWLRNIDLFITDLTYEKKFSVHQNSSSWNFRKEKIIFVYPTIAWVCPCSSYRTRNF